MNGVRNLASLWNILSSSAGFVLPFVGVLTVVVFIHELGHFLVARWCGVAVQAFSIGFGREIVAWTDKHGTRWRLAWIPLGGYVRFVDDETAASTSSKSALDKLSPEQRDGAFQSKSVGQRALVVAAGPAFNLISAVIIAIATVWAFGRQETPAVIDTVVPGGVAATAGLRAGDRITRLGTEKVEWFSDLQRIVSESPGRPLEVEYLRNDRPGVAEVTPQLTEIRNANCDLMKVSVIGVRREVAPIIRGVKPGGNLDKAGIRAGDRIIAIAGKPTSFASDVSRALIAQKSGKLDIEVLRAGRPVKATIDVVTKPARVECRDVQAASLDLTEIGGQDHLVHKSFGLGEAIVEGTQQSWFVARQIVAGIPRLPGAVFQSFSFSGQKELGGPIAIAEMTARASSAGIASLLTWISFFSIMLGIMNLLPVPVLDGGHLMFYALEAVRGRPLDEHKQEVSYRIGLAILATLMFSATFSDLTGGGNQAGALDWYWLNTAESA